MQVNGNNVSFGTLIVKNCNKRQELVLNEVCSNHVKHPNINFSPSEVGTDAFITSDFRTEIDLKDALGPDYKCELRCDSYGSSPKDVADYEASTIFHKMDAVNRVRWGA
jgi:hypothetical protein